MIIKISENFFQQTTTGVMAMKFSIKIKGKSGQALKLTGMLVEIRGSELLDARSAPLQYSEKDHQFEAQSSVFSQDEEVRLYINGDRMCHLKNGDTVVVKIVFERLAPFMPLKKRVEFIEHKA